MADAFHNTLDLAQHAEKWGYKRFWLAEHHNIPGVACSATSVLIGYVAAGTSSRFALARAESCCPNHAPLVIAEQFGTLEALYPGRIDLGLGRAPGGDFAVMRALRRGLGSNGDDFPELLEELRGFLSPAKPGQTVPQFLERIPVFLSGCWAQAISAPALPLNSACLSLLPDIFNRMAWWKRWKSTVAISALPMCLDRPYSMAGVPVMVAETDERARYLATTPQQMFLNLIRGNPGPLVPPVDHMEWNALERAAVQAKFRAAIFGSPETVREGLEKFLEETQVDELMVVSNPLNIGQIAVV